MAKKDPTKDPEIVTWLLYLYELGSGGDSGSHTSHLHHTKVKATFAAGLVETVETVSGWKKTRITEKGKVTLLQGGHLPDPSQQWRFCRDVLDLASKIVALENGWRLTDRGIRVHLPHVWRCVEDFHRQADCDTYNRNETMRYALHRAGDACEAYLTGMRAKAYGYVFEMRKMLDEKIAKGAREGFTKGQRDSWRHAVSGWMLDENREDLPPDPPAEQKTGS